MSIKPATYFLIFILLVMMMIIGLSLTFSYFESALLPLIVSSLVLILGSIQLWKELTTKHAAAKDEIKPGAKYPHIGSTIIWLVCYAFGIFIAGFMVAIPVFILGFMKWRGRNWLTSIAVALITTIFIFGMFEFLLRTELWRGLIFELLT